MHLPQGFLSQLPTDFQLHSLDAFLQIILLNKNDYNYNVTIIILTIHIKEIGKMKGDGNKREQMYITI